MTNEQIRMVFKIPEKDVLDFILNRVNLTNRQRTALELYYREGNTEEQCAEIMKISRNGFQNIKKDANKILMKAWQNDRLVMLLLKDEK